MAESLHVYADRLARLGPPVRRTIRAEMVATSQDASGRSQDLARERLRVRTGMLWRSIAGEVRDTTDGYDLYHRAGDTQVQYARLQEKGGTVTPKKGKFLAIPVGAALTPAGVPRFPGGPRSVAGLRFIPIRGGAAAILVRDIKGRGKSGTGGRSEILFRLVRRVSIKPKNYMRDGFDGAVRGLDNRIATRVAALLEGGAGVQ